MRVPYFYLRSNYVKQVSLQATSEQAWLPVQAFDLNIFRLGVCSPQDVKQNAQIE
jgi:hypothetical protein